MRSWRCGARLICNVGPPERKTENGSRKRKTDRIWLLRASGLFTARRRPICSNKHSLSAAPLSPGVFGQRGQVAACAVGEGRGTIEPRGRSIPMTPLLRWGSSAQRRGSGAVSGPAGTVDPFGLLEAPAPSIVRTSRVVRIVGLVSHGRVRSSISGRGRGWSTAPQFGSFNTPRLLRATVVRAQSEKRVKRSVRRTAGEFHVSRVGFDDRWYRHAPLGGSIRRHRTLERRRVRGLIRPARPTRKWSRRA